ncbi:hypothetical protein [Parvibacter caecicola]|uniref:hypothetical protein n=1 Tax=Parvibacter caecicola TaxID=747645 RepID=UPI002731F4C1|nr:hypothetical protein [Parvibacter caecicola]
MAANHKKGPTGAARPGVPGGAGRDALEVAHITGVQGIRAALERLADEDADVPLPGTVTEDAPHPRRTCAVCAADNDGARDTCWNCGASLRRVR